MAGRFDYNLGPENVGEFPDYSPVGDCHFLATALAVAGLAISAYGVKNQKDAQDKAVNQAKKQDKTAETKAALDAVVASNETLMKENSLLRSGIVSPRVQSDLYDPATLDTSKLFVAGGVLAVLYIMQQELI